MRPSAPSRVSRRNPAMRFFSSGPWHEKQFSDSNGRISRVKSMGFAAAGGAHKARVARERERIAMRLMRTIISPRALCDSKA